MIDPSGTEICNVQKPLNLEKGVYIGNFDCTPKLISELVTEDVLPSSGYDIDGCDVFVYDGHLLNYVQL